MGRGTWGQTGRFLIFCQVARENPERAATVESHPCAKVRARMGHPALRCIKFGVATADGQHLSVEQTRRRVAYGLPQLTCS
jgi:hypothetical protein